MDQAHFVDPGARVDAQGVDHQGVAFPVADALAHEGGLHRVGVRDVHVDVAHVVGHLVHDQGLARLLDDLDRIGRVHHPRHAVRPAVGRGVGDRGPGLLGRHALVALGLAQRRQVRHAAGGGVDLAIVAADEPHARQVARVLGRHRRPDQRPFQLVGLRRGDVRRGKGASQRQQADSQSAADTHCPSSRSQRHWRSVLAGHPLFANRITLPA